MNTDQHHVMAYVLCCEKYLCDTVEYIKAIAYNMHVCGDLYAYVCICVLMCDRICVKGSYTCIQLQAFDFKDL